MTREIRRDSKTQFLTMDEMREQIVMFLIAGFDTTAATLAFIAYNLALYPDVQKRLQQEIDKHFPTKGHDINFETVHKLSYLDMVFCEVSRLACVGQLAVQRRCDQTTQVNGFTIPKGARVIANIARHPHKSRSLVVQNLWMNLCPRDFCPKGKEQDIQWPIWHLVPAPGTVLVCVLLFRKQKWHLLICCKGTMW